MPAETKKNHGKKAPAEMAARRVDDAKLATMVEVMWDHRDALARMASELPSLLRATGEQMHDAGTRAQHASRYLASDVRELTAHAADMLQTSKQHLLAVLHALEKAGGLLKNLPFPFVGEMGKMMSNELGAIGAVADNLEQVGKNVRGLGDRLGDVGDDLHLMGASLLGGGAGLGAYGGPGARAPKASASKPAAPPKPRSAPAKKAPIKKSRASG